MTTQRVFFVLALCAASLVPVRAAGQKPAATSKTSWGDPDLQGTWSGDSAFAIPMQRPEALGTKAELTDQEFADLLEFLYQRRLPETRTNLDLSHSEYG